MKQIYVLRHADKDSKTNKLTSIGRERAKKLKEMVGTFDMVITSDRDRTKETAFLLTGQTPCLDARCGFFYFSEDQEKEIRPLAKMHSQSYAGVIIENKKYHLLAKTLGENLIQLIKEVIKKLPENGRALIVSQDGVMVAAEKLLTRKTFDRLDHYFRPLDGFIVDEQMKLTQMI